VLLSLVTKAEIEARMRPGPGRDPSDNRREEFRRDTAALVRLVQSAADQGGLLSGAELPASPARLDPHRILASGA
jgi:hypothetical protein